MFEGMRIGFIGVGRVGGTLALALHDGGYAVRALFCRGQAGGLIAEQIGARLAARVCEVADWADLVFITTNDAAIAPVCQEVAAEGGWRSAQAVVHCAGALGREVLLAAAACGAQTGVLHPLQTFPTVARGRAQLPGSVFSVEAEEPLRAVLYAMVAALGGQPMAIDPAQRMLYHAAAVMTANYTVALFATARQVLEHIGIAPGLAHQALLPLLRGAIESIEHDGLPTALTGPIARGDAEVVAHHVRALAREMPAVLGVYRELALATLPLAQARGLASQTMARFEQILRPEHVNDGA